MSEPTPKQGWCPIRDYFKRSSVVGLMVQKMIGDEPYVNYHYDAALVDEDSPHPEEEDPDYSDVEE
eukprot:scaffold141749_cov44-Cyclotella_meneghiniana.AAC.1